MQHRTELVFSLLTVALAIIAVVIFIYHRASIAFYLAAIAAIVIGLINAWLVSKVSELEPPRPAPRRRRPAARKRGARTRR